MIINGSTIRAEDGKVLRRLSDKMLFGEEVNLGLTWYIGGEPLDEPLRELPEHYEEVTLEQIDREREEEERIRQRELGEVINGLIRERYTLSEELALHRQRDTKKEEFEEYNAFCEECKQKAKSMQV